MNTSTQDTFRIAEADHGGGIDAAAALFGGARADWLDLSTGINPRPYPLPAFSPDVWAALPDRAAFAALEAAARQFWNVPDGAAVLAAPGASALIARMPAVLAGSRVHIPQPTYNEHARAFLAQGWTLAAEADATVVVHPNNPDGRLHRLPDTTFVVIDESFCDVMSGESLIAHAARPGVVVLKSFGKFWGLAGLRLGFLIGDPALVARMSAQIGPWAVSGPALLTGAVALNDHAWAEETRARLAQDAARLDALTGWPVAGGTTLFRLYDLPDPRAMQHRLARHPIWTRTVPWSDRLIRLGLPDGAGWARLERALA